MHFPLLLSAAFLIEVVMTTPPACLLSCINHISALSSLRHRDFLGLCGKDHSITGCLVDVCAHGNFFAARDHFWGTCVERLNNHHPRNMSQDGEHFENDISKEEELIVQNDIHYQLNRTSKDERVLSSTLNMLGDTEDIDVIILRPDDTMRHLTDEEAENLFRNIEVVEPHNL